MMLHRKGTKHSPETVDHKKYCPNYSAKMANIDKKMNNTNNNLNNLLHNL